MSKVPEGQTSRGTPVLNVPNPKSPPSRSVGRPADEGDSGQVQRGTAAASTGWDSGVSTGRADRGSPADIPDPDVINSTYADVTGSTPATTNVGANRQNFGLNPGDVEQPNGDTRDGVRIPKFGVGTTGE